MTREIKRMRGKRNSKTVPKFREIYINEDERTFDASKRMPKRLTKKMTTLIMDRIRILLIITDSADSDLGELGYRLTLRIHKNFLFIEDTLER